MKVNSTEIQNNFGKYLILAGKEDIIITRNGNEIAKLVAGDNILEQKKILDGIVNEKAEDYYVTGNFGGRKATYEEFVKLTKDNEDSRYEYIDGEIYLLSSPKVPHQAALTELFGTFYNWFKGKRCRPMVAPFDITLKRNANDINVVQPDIMVICDLDEKLAGNGYYMGVPRLMAEITSENTRKKDRIKKLNLYIDCGVEEYWIVNPADKLIFIMLLADCSILREGSFKSGETAKSFIFQGLAVDVDLVFR